MPRSRSISPRNVEEFTGPPEPGLFDKIKRLFTLPPLKGTPEEIVLEDVDRRFEKAAVLKPVIKEAAADVKKIAGTAVKKSVVVVVLALVVFLFVYAFAGSLAQKVVTR